MYHHIPASGCPFAKVHTRKKSTRIHNGNSTLHTGGGEWPTFRTARAQRVHSARTAHGTPPKGGGNRTRLVAFCYVVVPSTEPTTQRHRLVARQAVCQRRKQPSTALGQSINVVRRPPKPSTVGHNVHCVQENRHACVSCFSEVVIQWARKARVKCKQLLAVNATHGMA